MGERFASRFTPERQIRAGFPHEFFNTFPPFAFTERWSLCDNPSPCEEGEG
jgi:hypothetical protein